MNTHCPENSFCRSLGEKTRDRVCRACLRLQIKSRQELLFEQSARQIAIINDGVVISVYTTQDGKQKCAELLKPGFLLGVDSLFHHSKDQTSYLLALTDVKVCLFPVEAFQTFYQQSSEFSLAVLESLSSRLHKSVNHLLLMQNSSSEEKISMVLEYLESQGVTTSYLTHEDLGLLADLNRVTVTRAIKSINQLENNKK